MSAPHSQDPAAPAPGTINDPHHLLPEHATEETVVRRSGRGWIVALLVLLLIALIVWRIHSNNLAQQAQQRKAEAEAMQPVLVQTTPVVAETVPVFLSELGTVTPFNTVTLHTREDGQLMAVNFHEGQRVRKGELLLEIDPRPYQAALDQAIGNLAKDEANLKDEEAEAQRYTALYQAGVVSKEQQQQYISNAGQAEGSIVADKAAIETAKVNLGYTKIYSPIDGVVGLRQVDPGNIVHATDTNGVVVITQEHPIAVIFTVPEDQLAQIQQAMNSGRKLVVEAYDRSDAHMIASGTLATLDNEIDTTTGTAKAKAVFSNDDNTLFPNEFVNIRLILSERQNATVIPTAAIETGTHGDYVFVVNPGPTPANKRKNIPSFNASAEEGNTAPGANAPSTNNGEPKAKYHADEVPVHTDFVIGTNSILSDNELRPGQLVVTNGQEKLADGSNVNPQPARNPGATASPTGENAQNTPNVNAGGLTAGSSPVATGNNGGTNPSAPGSTAQTAVGSGSNGGSNGAGSTGNGGNGAP